MIKPTFKIWDWFLRKEYINVTDDIGYSLNGLTNQYPDKGYPLHTSIIIKIDFEKNIVETKNSIYELQTGPYQERNQKFRYINDYK
jgi:hypothetical protein